MNQTILFGGSGFLGPIILEKYPHIISVGRSPSSAGIAIGFAGGCRAHCGYHRNK